MDNVENTKDVNPVPTRHLGPFLALLVPTLVIWAILAPVFKSAKTAARWSLCSTNLKVLDQACLIYAGDFGDRLPRANRWTDSIEPYAGGGPDIRNPNRTDGEFGYAMNSSLSARLLSEIEFPENTVLIYETRQNGRNRYSPLYRIPEDVPLGREGASIGIAFVDGHAKFLPLTSVRELAARSNTSKLK